MAKELELPTNPGGVLAPEHVLGRDAFIAETWEWLEKKSVALLAPRRMGKTSICRRMNAIPAPGFACVWRDLEGTKSAQEFVQFVYQDADAFLATRTRITQKARDFAQALFGAVDTRWGKITLPASDWRQLLRHIFADLDAAAEKDNSTVVFMWDEFPVFIDDLAKTNLDDATALLDTLRAIRQTSIHARMVFTGSIGLHEVLSRLKRQGYNNAPFNDIEKRTVHTLEPRSAMKLAMALLRGTGVPLAVNAADAVVNLSEGHPYVIHYLVEKLKRRNTFTDDNTRTALDELLFDSDDPLALNHYLDRLATYLTPDQARLAVRVLDIVSTQDGASTDGISAALVADREEVLTALRVLRRDHYLLKKEGKYRFKLEMLRRWWREERDLS